MNKEQLQKLLHDYRQYCIAAHIMDKGAYMFPRIVCNDGFSFSAQASWSVNCEPREILAYWEAMELCFLSKEEPLLKDYEPERPLEDPYGSVPIQIIVDVINKHGGIKNIDDFSIPAGNNVLQDIQNWFKVAVPEPTDDNRRVQLGCHLEEVSEMMQVVEVYDYIHNETTPLNESYASLEWVAAHLKDNILENPKILNKVSFTDALADQVVTLVGLAHMHGIDLIGALQEVNRSNWSKFENGKPVFDKNGKITKGKDYTPPKLSEFVRE